jgi:ubiquinone/menaquinone biosynthesis C-methylase UbiE
MDYDKALERFGECYKDRQSVEFPTIFRLCDFRDKTILEIGAGRAGYFPKAAAPLAMRYVATDVSREILDELVSNVGVETKVCRAEKLPFKDRSFDIVFSRWVAQDVKDLEKAVGEMCRVAKENVVMVLPSEEGDETEMLKIKYPGKHYYRKQRIAEIKRWISEAGFKVKETRKTLNFIFPSIEEAVEIMSALGFSNTLSESEKQKLTRFFEKRKTRKGVLFSQGASFICGRRL